MYFIIRGHVPYRDSKLTRILQPALGGNANTAIICNITLAQVCYLNISISYWLIPMLLRIWGRIQILLGLSFSLSAYLDRTTKYSSLCIAIVFSIVYFSCWLIVWWWKWRYDDILLGHENGLPCNFRHCMVGHSLVTLSCRSCTHRRSFYILLLGGLYC